MSRFEYLSVLLSIVIALGISEVASAWGRMLRSRSRVRFYWLHAFWSVFTVLLMIQFWWGFWSFRSVETWSFAGLLGVVSEGLVLVVAAIVLLPSMEGTQVIDLRALFFEQSRLFFVLGALLIAQLTAFDHLIGDQPFFHPENLFRLPGIAVAVTAAVVRREAFHVGLAVAASALLVGFIAFNIAD